MPIYDVNGNPATDSDVLFANVMMFGASGDGTTDDANAIQDALDSLKTVGGVIYFPAGIYKITQNIHFYSNQTLYFEPGATILQGAYINNLLISYCESTWTGYTGTHDCLIYGATFDGGAYTTNNTLVGVVHAKNIIFENCTFKNGYGSWHDLEINASINIKVLNCDFEGSRKMAAGGELIQIDAALNSGVWPWDSCSYDSTVSKYVEIFGCYFHDDIISPAIGNHSAAEHEFIKIHNNIFDGFTASRGAISFNGGGTQIDIAGNTFNDCTTGVGSSGATYFIHENLFVGVTTAVAGNSSVSHGNMINGTYTA